MTQRFTLEIELGNEAMQTPDDVREALQRAIRRARSRANEVEVDTSKRIGNVLLKYVLGK